MTSRNTERDSMLPRRYGYLLILAACGFVTSFGAHVVATNLPAYARVAGVGAFTIGLLIAIYDFAELFAKPAAGVLADRRGMKAVLLAGLLLFIAGSLLFLVLDPAFLLLVRFVQGLGAAALSTVSVTLVAKYFANGNKGSAFGIYNAIKGAGYVIAPAIGGFLVQKHGFAAIFIVSAAVGAAAVLLSLCLPADRSRGESLADEEDELSVREVLRIFRAPRLLPIYAVIVINMFLVGILFGFLPVYLAQLSYGPLDAGFVVSTATASYLLIQPAAGVAADRLSPRATVLAGLLLASLAIVAVTFTSGVPLVITVIVAGIGVGTVWTNSDTLVSNQAEARALGAAMGAAQSFKEFGDMVGPVLVGLLTQWFGVRVGFVSCGALALLALALLARSASFRQHG